RGWPDQEVGPGSREGSRGWGDRARAQLEDAPDQRVRAHEARDRRGECRGAAVMIEGLQTFQNVFKIPELKRRVLITLGLLAAYRLGAHVPTPGIDGSALAEFFNQMQGTLLGMVDLFSGGNLRRLTVFALGIMPYISASIILQLLTVV